jgi:hypothetical protein
MWTSDEGGHPLVPLILARTLRMRVGDPGG